MIYHAHPFRAKPRRFQLSSQHDKNVWSVVFYIVDIFPYENHIETTLLRYVDMSSRNPVLFISAIIGGKLGLVLYI